MKKHCLPAAVLALAALGFTLGTCEFVIVGILPDIAAGLNVSLAAVGRLVSVFAACYAVGTPLLTALTGRMDRFRLLMGLMLLFLGVNVLSMLAPGVAVLYASRVVYLFFPDKSSNTVFRLCNKKGGQNALPHFFMHFLRPCGRTRRVTGS